MYPIIRSCGLGVPLAAALLAGPGIASAATFDYGSYSVVNEVNVHINPGSGTPALPTGFEYGYFGSGQIVLYGTGSNAAKLWMFGASTLPISCKTATRTPLSPHPSRIVATESAALHLPALNSVKSAR